MKDRELDTDRLGTWIPSRSTYPPWRFLQTIPLRIIIWLTPTRTSAAPMKRCTTARRTCRCPHRSEEHTSELQSRLHLVCRLLLEKKKKNIHTTRRLTLSSCRHVALRANARD